MKAIMRNDMFKSQFPLSVGARRAVPGCAVPDDSTGSKTGINNILYDADFSMYFPRQYPRHGMPCRYEGDFKYLKSSCVIVVLNLQSVVERWLNPAKSLSIWAGSWGTSC